MLGETVCRSLSELQFAFRNFHQAHEVVFIFRQLIEKAREWRAPHIFVMDADTKKAYDNASHRAFAESAREKGMDEILILAWLREWRRRRSVFRRDTESTSEEMQRTRSCPRETRLDQ